MLKDNKETLIEIDKYINNHTPTMFSRQCGKSGMILKMIHINCGLEMYKDVVKNAVKYMSFDQVLREVTDAIYQAYKECEEDE